MENKNIKILIKNVTFCFWKIENRDDYIKF